MLYLGVLQQEIPKQWITDNETISHWKSGITFIFIFCFITTKIIFDGVSSISSEKIKKAF